MCYKIFFQGIILTQLIVIYDFKVYQVGENYDRRQEICCCFFTILGSRNKDFVENISR